MGPNLDGREWTRWVTAGEHRRGSGHRTEGGFLGRASTSGCQRYGLRRVAREEAAGGWALVHPRRCCSGVLPWDGLGLLGGPDSNGDSKDPVSCPEVLQTEWQLLTS